LARCPFAVWHRCPGDEPAITPRVVVFHTMVGSLMGTEAYFCGGGSGGIESHFGVGHSTDGALDGQARQWRDTAEQADAQSQANAFAVSIETSDGGDPNRPWSSKQIDTLVRLGRWLAETHNIPKRICPSWDGSGFGWHRQYAQWNPNGHSCPGDVRLGQLKTIVLPRIFAATDSGGLSMADAASLEAQLNKLRDDLTVFGTTGLEQTVEAFAARQRDMLAKLNALLSQSIPTADEIAAAVVAALPATSGGSGLTVQEVEDAVATAVRLLRFGVV
jgi:N-acetylmuramoyl-L-alanine amidase